MTADDPAAGAQIDRMLEDGLTALEDEQYEVAAEIFRRVVVRAPFRHDARDYLAFALDQQFAREAGRPTAQRLNGVIGSSSAAASTASRARPRSFQFPAWLAATVLALAIFVIAVAALASRLDLRGWVNRLGRPAASPAIQRLTDEFRKADGAVVRQEFDKARQILQAAETIAAELDPPEPQRVRDRIAEVYAAEAESLASVKNYDKALDALKQGITYSSASAQLNYLTGYCYEKKAREVYVSAPKQKEIFYKQAIQALETATRSDPGHLDALLLLAKCYGHANQRDKKIQTCQRVIKQAKNSPQATAARNYLLAEGFKNP